VCFSIENSTKNGKKWRKYRFGGCFLVKKIGHVPFHPFFPRFFVDFGQKKCDFDVFFGFFAVFKREKMRKMGGKLLKNFFLLKTKKKKKKKKKTKQNKKKKKKKKKRQMDIIFKEKKKGNPMK
jgi:hypothetical protein